MHLSRFKPTLALTACFLAIASSLSQSHDPLPSFDVAVIRANSTALPEQGQWSLPDAGIFQASAVPLSLLIRLAYGIDDKQIANKPKWLDSKLFDVSAKSPGIKLSRTEIRPRLQSLLAQRFHLVFHRETRIQTGFDLVVGKKASHLKPTQGALFPGFRKNVSPGHLEGLNWSMGDLAAYITSLIARPVVDRTGIQGGYDISIQYAPDDTDSPLPPIYTALEETTGLRLVPAKVPVEVLVIDSVDSEPTPN